MRIHLKFITNQSGSFRDYLFNKIVGKRKTEDRQTETESRHFRIRFKRRENMNLTCANRNDNFSKLS